MQKDAPAEAHPMICVSVVVMLCFVFCVVLKSHLRFMRESDGCLLKKRVEVQRAEVQRAEVGGASKPLRDSQMPAHCTALRRRRRC